MVESLRQILQQQVIRGRSMPNITVLWLIMQIGWNKYKKLYNNTCEVISKPVVKEKAVDKSKPAVKKAAVKKATAEPKKATGKAKKA